MNPCVQTSSAKLKENRSFPLPGLSLPPIHDLTTLSPNLKISHCISLLWETLPVWVRCFPTCVPCLFEISMCHTVLFYQAVCIHSKHRATFPPDSPVPTSVWCICLMSTYWLQYWIITYWSITSTSSLALLLLYSSFIHWLRFLVLDAHKNHLGSFLKISFPSLIPRKFRFNWATQGHGYR